MDSHSGELYSTHGNYIKAYSIFMIEVPLKIWIPNQENKCRLPYYSDVIDDRIFDYKVFGKSIFKTNLSWEDRNRYDVIVLNQNLHLEELMRDIRVVSIYDQPTKDIIISIIKYFWGCYGKEGVQYIAIGYEFAIYTGYTNPVCCKNLSYITYESKII